MLDSYSRSVDNKKTIKDDEDGEYLEARLEMYRGGRVPYGTADNGRQRQTTAEECTATTLPLQR